MTTNLSTLLRRLRAQRGLTLQQASAAASITIGYLSDVERGRRVPTVAALDRLLGTYGYRLAATDEPGPRLLEA